MPTDQKRKIYTGTVNNATKPMVVVINQQVEANNLKHRKTCCLTSNKINYIYIFTDLKVSGITNA